LKFNLSAAIFPYISNDSLSCSLKLLDIGDGNVGFNDVCLAEGKFDKNSLC